MLCHAVSVLKSSAIVVLIFALAACTGSPIVSGDVNKLTGDENGGKIRKRWDRLNPSR